MEEDLQDLDETLIIEQAERAFQKYVGDQSVDDGIMHMEDIDTLALIAYGLECEIIDKKKEEKYELDFDPDLTCNSD